MEFNIESTSSLMQFMMKQYRRHLYDKKTEFETYLVVVYRVPCQIAEVDKFHVQSTKLSKDAAASRSPAPVSTHTAEFQQICIKKWENNKKFRITVHSTSNNNHGKLNK